jgi:hypothetical protein
MKDRNRNLLLGLIAILWIFGVTAAYFIGHKPFTPEFAGIIAQAVWRIALVSLVIACAGGFGYRLLRLEGYHAMARLSLQAALGLGILSIGIFVIGLAAWEFYQSVYLSSGWRVDFIHWFSLFCYSLS